MNAAAAKEIARLCDVLPMSNVCACRHAHRWNREADDPEPCTICGCPTFRDVDEEKTQVVLAQAAGITEVTIRNRCAELARLFASKKIPYLNPSLATIALVSIELAVISTWARVPALIR